MPVTRWRRVAQRRIHPIDGPGTVRQSPEATHKVNAGAAKGDGAAPGDSWCADACPLPYAQPKSEAGDMHDPALQDVGMPA